MYQSPQDFAEDSSSEDKFLKIKCITKLIVCSHLENPETYLTPTFFLHMGTFEIVVILYSIFYDNSNRGVNADVSESRHGVNAAADWMPTNKIANQR